MGLSKEKRFEVFKRDSFTCLYCGRRPPEVVLNVDHVVPASKGGSSDISNLATSCVDCNTGKGSKPLVDIPKAHIPSLVQRKEKLSQLQAMAQMAVESAEVEDSQFEVVSNLWMRLQGDDPSEWNLSGQSARAVRRFIRILPIEEVVDAVRITFRNMEYGNLNYFCAVCWKKVRQRQLLSPDQTTGTAAQPVKSSPCVEHTGEPIAPRNASPDAGSPSLG